ncbi:MAG TPA: response regulator transcription factor [Chloroflexi bacterium]|nr:response regulator transcription factor [Chloroflexota bacterium]
MDEIRVVIVDDHPFFREGLRNVLSSEDDLQVVGEASDGEEAVGQAIALSPHVILMDVNLPRLNGLEAMRRIKVACPDVSIVILTAYDDEEQVYRAVRAGASAYHAKDVDPRQLVTTIREVNAGRYVVGGATLTENEIGQWLLERFRQFGGEMCYEERYLSPLSPREMEILRLVVAGMSNKEIAYHLGISHQTVKNHITAVLSKLGVADRTQAAVYALRHGWVPLRSDSEDESP